MSLRVLGCLMGVGPGNAPVLGPGRWGRRSGPVRGAWLEVLCFYKRRAPLGGGGGGEVGSLLLELRQVGGELDDLLEVSLVDLAALGMVSLQELGLLSAVSAGAV